MTEKKDVKLEKSEQTQFEGFSRQLNELQMRIGQLEFEKQNVVEEIRKVLGLRALFWRDVCKKHGLSPEKNYRLEVDGKLKEVVRV